MAMFSTNINDYSGDLNNFLGGLGQRTKDFFGGQYGKITDFLDRYRQGIFGQETAQALNERLGKEVGLPAARESAQATQRTLNEIPATYTAATRGYDVNANQLGRITGTKQAAYAPIAQKEQENYQNKQALVNELMGYNQYQQEKELRPFQSEQQMLTDYQAREASGFSQENESKLNGYIEKMRGGIQLTTAEAAEANKLAMAKLDYDARKYAADKQFEGIKYQTDQRYSSDPLGLFG